MLGVFSPEIEIKSMCYCICDWWNVRNNSSQD